VLGVATAVPGLPPAARPVQRRTEARDFAQRRGLGDEADALNTSVEEGEEESSFPLPSEDDQRDEHGWGQVSGSQPITSAPPTT
jgi:hypothetical protein